MPRDTKSIANRVAALIPGASDNAVWRNRWADILEDLAETDDLTLLRHAPEAEAFERSFAAFVAEGFPMADVVIVPPGEYQRAALWFANLDRDLRSRGLRLFAAAVRRGDVSWRPASVIRREAI